MISRVLSAELPEHIGERVTIAGWLHRRRELKSVTFLVIRDRAGLAQVVPAAPRRRAGDRPGEETVLQVEGLVVANPQAPGGAELTEPVADAAVRAGRAAAVRPVPARPHRHAADDPGPRADDAAASAAAVRLRDRRGQRRGLSRRAGRRRASPRSSPRRSSSRPPRAARTSSGSTTSAGPRTWRSRPQFYKQAMVGVFERVFEVGPVFRAEPHDTGRHLAEYASLDAELGFITDHFDVMPVCRDAVAGMVECVRERAGSGHAAARRDAADGAGRDPARALHRGDGDDLSGDRRGRRPARTTSRPRTSGGCASGPRASTAASCCS